MTMNPTPAPMPMAQTRMSKSSLLSLICGVLGCVPFVSGALALLLGIIGFVKTGKPGVTGRWMAVIGAILGIGSMVLWTFFIGSFLAIFGVVMVAAQVPKQTAHDFIRDLSAGDVAAAQALAPDIAEDKLVKLSEGIKEFGQFKDTTFSSVNIDNNSAHLKGSAEFARGSHDVDVELGSKGQEWRVESISITP